MFGASSAARGQRRPYTAANGPAGYHNVQGTPSPMAHSSRRTYTSPDKGIAGANTLDDDQLREIQDTFELFDQDKDGYLTYFELKVSLAVWSMTILTKCRWLCEHLDLTYQRPRFCRYCTRTAGPARTLFPVTTLFGSVRKRSL